MNEMGQFRLLKIIIMRFQPVLTVYTSPHIWVNLVQCISVIRVLKALIHMTTKELLMPSNNESLSNFSLARRTL